MSDPSPFGGPYWAAGIDGTDCLPLYHRLLSSPVSNHTCHRDGGIAAVDVFIPPGHAESPHTHLRPSFMLVDTPTAIQVILVDKNNTSKKVFERSLEDAMKMRKNLLEVPLCYRKALGKLVKASGGGSGSHGGTPVNLNTKQSLASLPLLSKMLDPMEPEPLHFVANLETDVALRATRIEMDLFVERQYSQGAPEGATADSSLAVAASYFDDLSGHWQCPVAVTASNSIVSSVPGKTHPVDDDVLEIQRLSSWHGPKGGAVVWAVDCDACTTPGIPVDLWFGEEQIKGGDKTTEKFGALHYHYFLVDAVPTQHSAISKVGFVTRNTTSTTTTSIQNQAQEVLQSEGKSETLGMGDQYKQWKESLLQKREAAETARVEKQKQLSGKAPPAEKTPQDETIVENSEEISRIDEQLLPLQRNIADESVRNEEENDRLDRPRVWQLSYSSTEEKSDAFSMRKALIELHKAPIEIYSRVTTFFIVKIVRLG